MSEVYMNVNQLVNSSLKIQNRWLGDYDQSTFGDEIADNDLGYYLYNNIETLIEEYLDDRIELYEVFNNLNKKELKKVKKSSYLPDYEIEDIKKEIVERELMDLSCDYIFYSPRKCEDEQVFPVFLAAHVDGMGSVTVSLYGIFKSLEDARKALINQGCYVDEYQNHHF
jgi:hypothetical protein